MNWRLSSSHQTGHLRLSDMQRIAEELSDRFAGEIRPVSCTVEDVRVVLNLLEELADCRFIRLDPDTGGPVGEVSAVEVERYWASGATQDRTASAPARRRIGSPSTGGPSHQNRPNRWHRRRRQTSRR